MAKWSKWFDVVDGPSREVLFDALRLCVEQRTIDIIYIREQKTRERFYLSGIIVGSEYELGKKWIIKAIRLSAVGVIVDTTIDFNTETRKGKIKFVK